MIELQKEAVRIITPTAIKAGLSKEEVVAVIAHQASELNEAMASISNGDEETASNIRACIEAMKNMDLEK